MTNEKTENNRCQLITDAFPPERRGGLLLTAREGDALAVPAVLGEQVAYDEALAARPSS